MSIDTFMDSLAVLYAEVCIGMVAYLFVPDTARAAWRWLNQPLIGGGR